MVKFEKDSKEFGMMRDYYVLMQEFWNPDRSDAFWEDFDRRTSEFYIKYDRDLYARGLVDVLREELQRKMRRGLKKKEGE